MKKRLLSIVAAACLVLSMTGMTGFAVEQATVLETVKALGIMVGDETGNMNLSQSASRAQFVKMMTAASSYKDSIGSGYGNDLFKDVKSNHWASEYIKLGVEQNWIVGYTDGTFRPENNITLEEGCTALLRLLGYDSGSLAGSFPTAQLSKAAAIGLLDDVTATQGQNLTRQNCATMFYNLLTVENSGGAVYGTTLGYTITNGEVDYSAIVNADLKGPYVSSNGQLSLPFNSEGATVYRNGSLSSLSAVKQYDVYYYNASLNTVWVYNDRVTGTLTAVSPNRSAPTAVTVGGVTYTVGTSTATYHLSSQGSFPDGTTVTLLLGMNGEVVDVMSAQQTDDTCYGVVVSSAKSASAATTTTSDNTSVQVQTEVACTNGEVRTFYYTGKVFSAGDLVMVNTKSGETTVKTLSKATLSGTISSDGATFAGYTFSDSVEILDTDSSGGYKRIYPSRLAGAKLTESDVRYYTVDEAGKIERMILNQATGDSYNYVLLTKAEVGSSATAYTYIHNGDTVNLNTTSTYSITTGGVALIYDSGNLKRMLQMGSAEITQLSDLYALCGNKKYMLDEDVQVLLWDKDDRAYYATTLARIDTENYTLKAYYDTFSLSAGGRIRIIVAQ